MNRSLMIMFVMGVLAMVMITMSGSFFVGKVGGAENVGMLRRDLIDVFGSQMADPEALSVKVQREDEVSGLLIKYEASTALWKNAKALEYQMGRIAQFIMRGRPWSERLAWVELRITNADGKKVQRRYANKMLSAPE